MPAPLCPACDSEARLMFGSDACPDRPDLADAPVWACTICDDTYAECWPSTESPMGGLADGGLRDARATTAAQVDRILRGAGHGALAADRMRNFLACHVGVERDAADVRLFDLDQCRTAYAALARADLTDIDHWSRTYRGPVKAKRETLV